MDGDLHAALAAVVSADEVVPPGLGERDEVLSTAPVPIRSINSAVVVAGSVDLIHIIHILLIPESCEKQRTSFRSIEEKKNHDIQVTQI